MTRLAQPDQVSKMLHSCHCLLRIFNWNCCTFFEVYLDTFSNCLDNYNCNPKHFTRRENLRIAESLCHSISAITCYFLRFVSSLFVEFKQVGILTFFHTNNTSCLITVASNHYEILSLNPEKKLHFVLQMATNWVRDLLGMIMRILLGVNGNQNKKRNRTQV